MKKGVLIWGYLASFILLLGAIFMNLNFIAGKVLYLIGFMAFNIGYLIPLFYAIFRENQENKIGIVLVFGILGFLTFLTGVSFFVVNWGGGIVLIYVGGGILILAILSIIAMSRRFYETRIDSWFPVLIFSVFIVVSLLTGMVHRHIMRAFALNNIEQIELLNSVRKKNEQQFNQLILLDTLKCESFNQIKADVYTLRNNSESIYNYIENLKIDLVKEVESGAYKMLDKQTLENLVPVQSNVEINSVTRFMLKKKKGKAYELKRKLDEHRASVLTMIPPEKAWLHEYITIHLNTKTYPLSKRRFNHTWAYQQFYNFPLITVLTTLTDLEWRVSSVEGELLNYYHQKALLIGRGTLPLSEKKME
jgi:thioredoxin-related protein